MCCSVSGCRRNFNGDRYFSGVTLCCWVCNFILLALLDPEDEDFMMLCIVVMTKFHVPEELNVFNP